MLGTESSNVGANDSGKSGVDVDVEVGQKALNFPMMNADDSDDDMLGFPMIAADDSDDDETFKEFGLGFSDNVGGLDELGLSFGLVGDGQAFARKGSAMSRVSIPDLAQSPSRRRFQDTMYDLEIDLGESREDFQKVS